MANPLTNSGDAVLVAYFPSFNLSIFHTPLQLLTQNALAMAVRTVMMKLITVFNVSFFICV